MWHISLQVLLLILGISLVTLLHTSREKSRVVSIAWVCAGVHMAYILFYFFYSTFAPPPSASLIGMGAAACWLYVVLTDVFLLRFRDEEDNSFDRLTSLGVGIFFCVLFIIGLLTRRVIMGPFLPGTAIVCFLGFMCRRPTAKPSRFQASALLVVFLFVGLYCLSPIVSARQMPEDYLSAVLDALASNAHFAVFPYAFFASNLIRLKLIEQPELKKVFRLVFLCVVGSACYNHPLAREFVDKIPIFKDIVPPSTSVVALMVPGITSILRVRQLVTSVQRATRDVYS
jgi:hypothetical protein